jgi:hypothetical protein
MTPFSATAATRTMIGSAKVDDCYAA